MKTLIPLILAAAVAGCDNSPPVAQSSDARPIKPPTYLQTAHKQNQEVQDAVASWDKYGFGTRIREASSRRIADLEYEESQLAILRGEVDALKKRLDQLPHDDVYVDPKKEYQP